MTYTAGPWRAVNRSSDGIDDPFLGWDVEGPPQAERGQFARREDAVLAAGAPALYEAGGDLLDALLTAAPSTTYPRIVQDAMRDWIAAFDKAGGREVPDKAVT